MASKKKIAKLRDDLLTAQSQLTSEKPVALAIIVTGMPTAGRSEVVNQFLEWMDAKHIKVYALNALHEEVNGHPPMRRYWETLPARGEMAIYFLGWYEDYLAPTLHAEKNKQDEARAIERIRQFEQMLHQDRVRILKLDLRVDRKTQKARIEALRSEKATRWRVTAEDRWLAKHYDRLRKAMDRVISATDTPVAPWHVIDGADPDERVVAAASHMLAALQAGVSPPKTAVVATPWPSAPAESEEVRFDTAVEPPDDETYERELERLQGRLALLTRKRAFEQHSVVLAFEGMDAAGKGGAIRRVTAALDARQYTVIPVSAPTAEELSRPYLWRFWRNLPERGELAIFDRSWYGRVLVERVRDLASESDWRRAYDEINEFELQLAESNVIVHKFWLSVSKEEQLQRFQAREQERLKRFKVDQEDWANRRFYDDYQQAAQEMIRRTSQQHAPWTVVAADSKKSARLKVLSELCASIERALTRSS